MTFRRRSRATKMSCCTYVLEDKDPHVLMRHFACRALLTCMEA